MVWAAPLPTTAPGGAVVRAAGGRLEGPGEPAAAGDDGAGEGLVVGSGDVDPVGPGVAVGVGDAVTDGNAVGVGDVSVVVVGVGDAPVVVVGVGGEVADGWRAAGRSASSNRSRGSTVLAAAVSPEPCDHRATEHTTTTATHARNGGRISGRRACRARVRREDGRRAWFGRAVIPSGVRRCGTSRGRFRSGAGRPYLLDARIETSRTGILRNDPRGPGPALYDLRSMGPAALLDLEPPAW